VDESLPSSPKLKSLSIEETSPGKFELTIRFSM
jgi:hypothetical protein